MMSRHGDVEQAARPRGDATDSPTRRIASLLAAGTEICCALELADALVAISHECDFPPEVLDRPRVTRTRIRAEANSRTIDEQVRAFSDRRTPLYEVDFDRLAALRCDLIVTQTHCDVCAVSEDVVIQGMRDRSELSRTAIVSLNPTTLEAMLDDVLKVGRAAGVPDRAAALHDQLAGRIRAIRQRTVLLPAEQRPRVACIEWIEPVMVAANWTPQLVEIAGGRHDLTRAGARSAYTVWEDVRRYDPEVIVILPCGFDLERAVREAPPLWMMPGWRDLAAARKGRVWAVDGNAYFNRAGPRLVDSVEILAGILHAELFPAPPPAAARRLPA